MRRPVSVSSLARLCCCFCRLLACQCHCGVRGRRLERPRGKSGGSRRMEWKHGRGLWCNNCLCINRFKSMSKGADKMNIEKGSVPKSRTKFVCTKIKSQITLGQPKQRMHKPTFYYAPIAYSQPRKGYLQPTNGYSQQILKFGRTSETMRCCGCNQTVPIGGSGPIETIVTHPIKPLQFDYQLKDTQPSVVPE